MKYYKIIFLDQIVGVASTEDPKGAESVFNHKGFSFIPVEEEEYKDLDSRIHDKMLTDSKKFKKLKVKNNKNK